MRGMNHDLSRSGGGGAGGRSRNVLARLKPKPKKTAEKPGTDHTLEMPKTNDSHEITKQQLVSSLRQIICKIVDIPSTGLPNISTSCAVNAAVQFMIAFPEIKSNVQKIANLVAPSKQNSKIVLSFQEVLNNLMATTAQPALNTNNSEILRNALINFRRSLSNSLESERQENDNLGDSMAITRLLIDELDLRVWYAGLRPTFNEIFCYFHCMVESKEDAMILLIQSPYEAKINSLSIGTNFDGFSDDLQKGTCQSTQQKISQNNPCKGFELKNIYIKIKSGQKSVCWYIPRASYQVPGSRTIVFKPDPKVQVYVLNHDQQDFEAANEADLQAKCTLRNLELRALTFSTGAHFYAARRDTTASSDNDWFIYDDASKPQPCHYDNLMNSTRQTQVLMILYVLCDQ